MALDLNTIVESPNLVDHLKKKQLEEISAEVLNGFEIDERSMAEWKEQTEKVLKLAKQISEQKNSPWEKAANVKFPLISRSVIDFAARTYPEIIQNDKVVKMKVYGDDITGKKQIKANNVGAFMNWQLLEADDNWEIGTDKLLHMLPLTGTAFRKTYYDPITRKVRSTVCNAFDLVVNRAITDFEEARRVTHIIQLNRNDIVTRMRMGLFTKLDLEKLAPNQEMDSTGTEDFHSTEHRELNDPQAPYTFLEQHCWWDFDGDGYQEPYIITVHKETGTIARIKARFSTFDIQHTSDGKVRHITAKNFFTDFHFIRNPDGGFFSIGLGHLLYPINETINDTFNMLLNSGALSTSSGGFIGGLGLRLNGQTMRVKMNEYKILRNISGDDLRRNIVEFPRKEPSSVLFQLLGLLIETGKELSSVNDILQGKQAATNVPATTILALIEQGMKVFSAVQKRIMRSFKNEYKKIFKLNRVFVSNNEYQRVLDKLDALVEVDFDEDSMDISPVADPSMTSDAQRLQRAQAIMQVQGYDEDYKLKLYAQALQFPDSEVQQLMPKEKKPDPGQQEIQMKVQEALLKAQNENKRLQVLVEQLKIQAMDAETRRMEAMKRMEKMDYDAQATRDKIALATFGEMHDAEYDQARLEQEGAAAELDALTKLTTFEAKQNAKNKDNQR